MNSAKKEVVLHCLKSMIDEEVREECPLYGTTGTDHCEKDCVRFAIDTLEQQSCDDFLSREERFKMLMETGEFDFLKDIPSDTIWKLVFALGFIQNEDTCSDAISRQAVLDAICKICAVENKPSECKYKKGLFGGCKEYEAIKVIPSAEPKTGHWFLLDECSNSGYYCSECQKKVVKEGWSDTVKKIKFCPNCGAKMEETEK